MFYWTGRTDSLVPLSQPDDDGVTVAEDVIGVKIILQHHKMYLGCIKTAAEEDESTQRRQVPTTSYLFHLCLALMLPHSKTPFADLTAE